MRFCYFCEMKIAYFGTQASNTHLAALQIFENETFISNASILDCFKSVENGDVEKAVVPLENSIEGTVSLTLDYLYGFGNIFIESEVVMPIAHHLMIHPDNQCVEKVYSHPQALAQCFKFLNKNYADAFIQEFASTSAAAKRVADNPDKNYAAIANSYAAKTFGLRIVHANIHDFEQNHTRFIVISKKQSSLKLAYRNLGEKTSLIVTLPEDHAGGLHQVLSVFAWRNMNLSKIESRTLKTGLGHYFFFINIVGNWDNLLYRNSILELESIGAKVKFLGNYEEYLLEA